MTGGQKAQIHVPRCKRVQDPLKIRWRTQWEITDYYYCYMYQFGGSCEPNLKTFKVLAGYCFFFCFQLQHKIINFNVFTCSATFNESNNGVRFL